MNKVLERIERIKEKTAGNLKKTAMSLALAGIPIVSASGQTNEGTTKASQEDKQEMSVSQDQNEQEMIVRGLARRLGVSVEHIGGVVSVDGLTENSYVNEQGKKVSQLFSTVSGWSVMDETVEGSRDHRIVAKRGQEKLDFTQTKYEYLKNTPYYFKGTCSIEATGEVDTTKFSGEYVPGKYSKIRSYSHKGDNYEMMNVRGIVERIAEGAEKNRGRFGEVKDNVNLQSPQDAKSSITFPLQQGGRGGM